jgi:hypothetical protein
MKRFLLLVLIVSLFGTMAFANGGDEMDKADDTIVVVCLSRTTRQIDGPGKPLS